MACLTRNLSVALLSSCFLLVGCRSFRAMKVDPENLSQRQVAPSQDASDSLEAESPPDPIEQVQAVVTANPPIPERVSPPPVQEGYTPHCVPSNSPARISEDIGACAAFEARVAEMERVGKQIADAATSAACEIEFETVYNPRRASTFHTEAGHILMTSSMLEGLETRYQLAAVLAMEVAKYLEESQQEKEQESLTLAGIPSGATVNGETTGNQKISSERIRQTASDLLTRAGFESLDLAQVETDVEGILAAKMPTKSTKPSEKTDSEPKWKGPEPIMAN